MDEWINLTHENGYSAKANVTKQEIFVYKNDKMVMHTLKGVESLQELNEFLDDIPMVMCILFGRS